MPSFTAKLAAELMTLNDALHSRVYPLMRRFLYLYFIYTVPHKSRATFFKLMSLKFQTTGRFEIDIITVFLNTSSFHCEKQYTNGFIILLPLTFPVAVDAYRSIAEVT